MKNIITKVWVLLFAFALLSCSESELDEFAPHILTAENLYSDVEGFQLGVNALYANARMERYNLASPSSLTIQFALGGTDIIGGTYWTQDQNAFGDRITPEHEEIRNLWGWLYSIINASNIVINRAETVSLDWSEVEKNQIIAEAKFFRAWAYRHLSFSFGDVPLSLNEIDEIKTDWVRAPLAEVQAQIISDLEFAAAHLTTVPNGNASSVTSWVAKHYLAEMHLTVGNSASAETIALDVVDNSPFSLVTARYGVTASEGGSPFTDMFINGNRNRSEGNTEGMWNYQFEYDVIGGAASYNRRIFLMRYDKMGFAKTAERGGTGKGYLGATSYLFDLYRQNPGDDRFNEFAWRKSYTAQAGDNPTKRELSGLGYEVGDVIPLFDTAENLWFGNTRWSSTRKFEDYLEDNVGTSNGYNDYTALRLANTYLLLAEAQFKNGNAAGAASTINVLRDRANTTNVVAAEIDVDFILDERGRELFAESHRKYHLLRNNVWLSRTNDYNLFVEGRATSRDKMLPIPQSVIDANITSTMEQNSGY